MSGVPGRVAALLPPSAKRKIRSAIHPAQRYTAKRAVAKKPQYLGLLSVVIPAFNVEAYIAECLTSVIAQTYPYLDIIVVDDGSTDGTVRIARQFSKWDKRIRVVELQHAGNGHARNVGISLAKGEFLAFADSDDVVAPGAYGLMVKTLATTKSDFVVGSSDRLIGTKRIPTKLSSRMHAVERLGIAIAEFPEIFDDVFLWNKAFRKSFWETAVAPIPEGVLYEDQETTARAFLRAKSFDVLTETVYSWRQVATGKSPTRSHTNLEDLQDRLSVAISVSEMVGELAKSHVAEAWFRRLFGTDLIPYYEKVPSTTEDYWDTLREGVRKLHALKSVCVGTAAEFEVSIDPHARVLRDLAVEGKKGDLERVIVDRIENGIEFEVHVSDGKFFAEPNYWPHFRTSSPRNALPCSPAILQFDSNLELRGATPEGGLRLGGYSFIRGLTSTGSGIEVSLYLCLANGHRLDIPISYCVDPNVDELVNDAFASHGDASFEAIVPARILRNSSPSCLEFELVLSVADVEFRARHDVPVPYLTEVPANLKPDKKGCHVVGFSSDSTAEIIYIDIDWGTQTPNRQVYLSTRQNRIGASNSCQLVDGIHRYQFRLTGTKWNRKFRAPVSGAYTLRYMSETEWPGATYRAVPVARQFEFILPSNLDLTYANARAWVTPNGSFAVTISPPLTLDERSKYGRRQLQQTFCSVDQVQVESHMVFESFGGKFCTDSPRAISDAMHAKDPSRTIYWSIVDFSVSYPEYATPLLIGSRAWFEVIQSAAILVNNNNFPFYFRKNPKQKYMQTWHGTPIKRIGLDAPSTYISPAYRELMKREADYWDILLAQNRFSADVLPGSFGYHGRVLTQGYPRNDALVSLTSDDQRQRVRSILGVSSDKIVVLYAPTWRDNARTNTGANEWIGYLDFSQAEAGLGENYVFLLRGHHNVLHSVDQGSYQNVIDVSDYPEVNDLILASDLLVTDYSSIYFDYLLTNKPIHLLSPDLSDYENHVRGFYLDYNSLVAGKLNQTTEDLVSEIAGTPSMEDSEKYQSLREKFVPFSHESISLKILESLI
jgi:CDP-glycerol glycerophosphotransferase (TagB/SpsB family)